MNDENFLERYEKLKFQEMFEKDEDKRKELSKQIKTFETTHKRNEINEMFDDDEHMNLEFQNFETMEIPIEGGMKR